MYRSGEYTQRLYMGKYKLIKTPKFAISIHFLGKCSVSEEIKR